MRLYRSGPRLYFPLCPLPPLARLLQPVLPGYHAEMAGKRKSPPTPALEHRYNTRQAARLTEDPQPLQVLVVSPSRAKALATHTVDAQCKFIEGVGIVTNQVEPLKDILDAEMAEVLSCALQHQRYEGKLTDPYFTEESRRQKKELPC